MNSLGQQVWAGIVFNSDLLDEPWFLVLTAFVSLNTIVFVGLSLGKVFYWPKMRIRFVAQKGNRDKAAGI